METDFPTPNSTWIAARCLGEDPSVFAHTNPVFVEVSGRAIHPGNETLEPLLAVLDRTRTWVERQAVCETDRQRQHLLDVLLSARRELESRE